MNSHELTHRSMGKGLLGAITRYLNFDEIPESPRITKEDLMFNAWSATGKHLKKALEEYGEETKKQGTERRNPSRQ